ncbi:hypothetical protein FE257_008892 [Aspergillus nanangensis]|uniref:SGNH hydrolase-type esterase domain-containing protein n=1 Tax=Aspergillus nanangensis TaxID=2582783 RepID=A0AAD4GYH2_ASPNN|nr:hypothetical protein FE257_008892 [Aspergillus nanangensis]
MTGKFGLFGMVLWAFLALATPDEYSNGPSHLISLRSDQKVPLRILPLGASLTWGRLSASGNGYRGPLRNELELGGWNVTMVGRKRHGTMYNNEVEAHSGDTIDEIKAAAQYSLQYEPNVVLINAGTNDCRESLHIPQAGERMESLIYSILDARGMDKTTIILSTLLPSIEPSTASNIPSVNQQYRELAKSLQAENVPIVLADMNPDDTDAAGRLTFPGDFDHDGVVDHTHPNDHGYTKMATFWYKAILDASERGFLKVPNVVNELEQYSTDGSDLSSLTQRGNSDTVMPRNPWLLAYQCSIVLIVTRSSFGLYS